MQGQKAVSAYFTSKQILPFGFAELYCSRPFTLIYLVSHRLSDPDMRPISPGTAQCNIGVSNDYHRAVTRPEDHLQDINTRHNTYQHYVLPCSGHNGPTSHIHYGGLVKLEKIPKSEKNSEVGGWVKSQVVYFCVCFFVFLRVCL